MNKTEYMKILSKKLRRLPKEDYARAIEYFEEYFEEAGPENEQQAIQDLGSPEEAARELSRRIRSRRRLHRHRCWDRAAVPCFW